MRTIKIVADSSANLFSMERAAFSVAPLKIITDDKEFTDTADLCLPDMIGYFEQYKGKSKTSCPNPSDWLDAFGDADDIICVTITSGLSGSYNAACSAKQIYEAEHPDRRVFVLDTLSAGPEPLLALEKLEELVAGGESFETICQTIQEYTQNTGLLFMLESLKNFAANGRVSPAVAKLTGILGIRIVGKASDEGTLEPSHKCRGRARSLQTLVADLQKYGFVSGKVRIAHCENLETAQQLKEMIWDFAPNADVSIHACAGLCSYYAEKGGLLIGFEKC